MLSSGNFWVGVVVGAILLWTYSKYAAKKAQG